MPLKERIDKEYTDAMKAKEGQKVSTLRMLRAAVKNAEIEKMKKFETDTEVEAVVRSEVKKLKEALETATSAGRSELAAKAEEELRILAAYLPEQLDEAAVRTIVRERIAALGSVTPNEMGRVVGEVMKVAKGRADGALVSKVVSEELKGK